MPDRLGTVVLKHQMTEYSLVAEELQFSEDFYTASNHWVRILFLK